MSLDNVGEILQCTNPLNRLEYNTKDLSNRYVIIVAPTAYPEDIRYMPEIARLLKKSGYNDDNVFLIFNPGDKPDAMKDSPIKVDYQGTSEEEPTSAKFLDYIKNLPSDGNDMVLVYSNSQGHADGIKIGKFVTRASEYSAALKEMKCGEAIVNVASCEAGAFAKKIVQPNMLIIAFTSETGHTAPDLTPLLKYLDSGFSVTEAFDRFKTDSVELGHESPVWCPGRDDPFMNPVVYIRQP